MAKSAHPPVIAAVTNESLKENSQSIMSSGNKHQSERVSDVERTSIWNRKLDSVYWVFFVVHVPIMLSEYCCLSPVTPVMITLYSFQAQLFRVFYIFRIGELCTTRILFSLILFLESFINNQQ